MTKRLLLALTVYFFIAACASMPAINSREVNDRADSAQSRLPDPPAGLLIQALPYTFKQPTQFFVDGNTLWVAQLNGGENQSQGQVVTVELSADLALRGSTSSASTSSESNNSASNNSESNNSESNNSQPQIQLNNLDKPTGIALINDTLWIATRNALLKWPIANTGAAPEPILTDLPNNGRSNGTLTVTPAGKLIYETSGNSRDADSGKLWEFDPQTNQSRVIATGLKGGYAHTFDEQGRLWLTEIADGAVGGVTLPGEVNMLNLDAESSANEIPDFGWPRCYGRELAGPDCTNVRAAVTTLPTHSTPTGIALSPFVPNTLLVALWVTGQVVEVPFVFQKDELNGENAIGDAVVWFSGLNNPQHMETQANGSVLISDFATGQIYRVEAAE